MKEGKLYLLPVLAGKNHEAAETLAKAGLTFIPLLSVDPLRVLETVRAKTPFKVTDDVAMLAYKLSLPLACRSVCGKADGSRDGRSKPSRSVYLGVLQRGRRLHLCGF